ncbi:MAG: DUF721 domain-containing protein [Microthrixaceae bacterium]|nr:DUF721 domain-containing protein [Microthrixaceae bacterium]HMS12068.1 DUF721 domain-containing protein [Microthrixaceae bacterium]HMT22922.1 DUF721 domain-containing protein [Microthrixaceae bacterium]HMT60560.1 DUF721 domain-containing protein [Microthrixaceae bacterium]
MTPRRPAAPLAASVDQLRRHLGLGSLSVLDQLTAEWPTLVGDELADLADIIEIRDRTLTIGAPDAATAEAVRWARGRILERVRAVGLGAQVDDVSVRVIRSPRPR